MPYIFKNILKLSSMLPQFLSCQPSPWILSLEAPLVDDFNHIIPVSSIFSLWVSFHALAYAANCKLCEVWSEFDVLISNNHTLS